MNDLPEINSLVKYKYLDLEILFITSLVFYNILLKDNDIHKAQCGIQRGN